jgi:hypothetical protein
VSPRGCFLLGGGGGGNGGGGEEGGGGGGDGGGAGFVERTPQRTLVSEFAPIISI